MITWIMRLFNKCWNCYYKLKTAPFRCVNCKYGCLYNKKYYLDLYIKKKRRNKNDKM